MQPIASTVSASSAIDGNDHNSGYDFKLLNPNSGSITVSCPSGISFSIYQNKSNAKDPVVVSGASNGTVIPAGTLNGDDDYYIGDPKFAATNFVVTLSQ